MKKILLLLLIITPFTTIYSQEDGFDGFGDEGDGDAQTNAPNAPIDSLVIPLLVTGILTSIYFISKKEKQLN